MRFRLSSCLLSAGLVLFAGWIVAAGRPAIAAEPKLELQKGDHICYIGNTLADRMQHHGWLETLVQSHFPDLQLTFRNLGYPADELNNRGVKALFQKHRSGNAMDYIVGNDIYNHLERVMDRFEDVANGISGLAIEQS